MTISLFEQFTSPATMIAAEQELLANPEGAVCILESLFSGQAKNQFGVPYRELGLPLRCALEVVCRLGPIAKPLEGYLASELRDGNFVAAMALGSLGNVAESSVAALVASLAGNGDLSYESAAALIRCGQAEHPLVVEVASTSKNAANVLHKVAQSLSKEKANAHLPPSA